MTIIINTEFTSTKIPVVIGDLTFEFDTADDAIKKLEKTANELSGMFENEDSEATIKDALKKGFELLLGKGAYKKIYAQTPSVTRTLSILEQVTIAITKELSLSNIGPQTQAQKAEQYVREKKKKRKNK